MNADELRNTLRSLGWKQADLARKAGVHRTTVQAWATEGPPPWVAEYLGALVAIQTLHARFVLAPPRERMQAGDDEPIEGGRAAAMAARLAGMDPASISGGE